LKNTDGKPFDPLDDVLSMFGIPGYFAATISPGSWW